MLGVWVNYSFLHTCLINCSIETVQRNDSFYRPSIAYGIEEERGVAVQDIGMVVDLSVKDG